MSYNNLVYFSVNPSTISVCRDDDGTGKYNIYNCYKNSLNDIDVTLYDFTNWNDYTYMWYVGDIGGPTEEYGNCNKSSGHLTFTLPMLNFNDVWFEIWAKDIYNNEFIICQSQIILSQIIYTSTIGHSSSSSSSSTSSSSSSIDSSSSSSEGTSSSSSSIDSSSSSSSFDTSIYRVSGSITPIDALGDYYYMGVGDPWSLGESYNYWGKNGETNWIIGENIALIDNNNVLMDVGGGYAWVKDNTSISGSYIPYGFGETGTAIITRVLEDLSSSSSSSSSIDSSSSSSSGPQEFIFNITTTTSPQSLTLPLTSRTTQHNFTAYWGDGSSSAITAYNDANRVHSYATAGNYTVRIVGTMPSFSFINVTTSRLLVTSVEAWGRVGLELLNFFNCTNLVSLPSDIDQQGKLSNITGTGLQGTFYGCTSLASIPSGIFKNCNQITGFGSTFRSCTSLTSIPSNLFDDTTSCTTFANCFLGCSGITGALPELWNTYPSATGTACFSGCTNASNYDDVPDSWGGNQSSSSSSSSSSIDSSSSSSIDSSSSSSSSSIDEIHVRTTGLTPDVKDTYHYYNTYNGYKVYKSESTHFLGSGYYYFYILNLYNNGYSRYISPYWDINAASNPAFVASQEITDDPAGSYIATGSGYSGTAVVENS